jgi:SLA1 homology domain 1, SHD1
MTNFISVIDQTFLVYLPPLLGDANSAVNRFLDDNPIVLAGIAMILAIVFGIFGFIGIKHGVTWSKYGTRIEGGQAKFKGWVFAVVSGFCFLYSVSTGLSALSGGFGFGRPSLGRTNFSRPDFVGNPGASNIPSPFQPARQIERPQPVAPNAAPVEAPPENAALAEVHNKISEHRKKMEERMEANPKAEDEDYKEAERRIAEAMRKAEEQIAKLHDSAKSGRPMNNVVFEDITDYAKEMAKDMIVPAQPALQPGEALDLGRCEVALPAMKYDFSKAELSKLAGFNLKGSKYEARGPESSILVGMVVGFEEERKEEISNLRPIYLLNDQYHYGELIGAPSSNKSETLLAKPGYAVGGANLRTTIGVKTLQLIYLEIENTGRLNKSKQYLSKTVGTSSGSEERLYADGWHIVGLFGYEEDDGVLALGLVGINARLDKSVQSPRKVDLTQSRTWMSANEKFKVEAKFVKIADGKVELLRSDNGKTVSVEISQLCAADQKLLAEHGKK